MEAAGGRLASAEVEVLARCGLHVAHQLPVFQQALHVRLHRVEVTADRLADEEHELVKRHTGVVHDGQAEQVAQDALGLGQDHRVGEVVTPDADINAADHIILDDYEKLAVLVFTWPAAVAANPRGTL